MQHLCAMSGSLDELRQRVDLRYPWVLEAQAHTRQLELTLGLVGKSYVGYKALNAAKPPEACAIFASLEHQIHVWICKIDYAAGVFQMEHEEPTDEIVLVSQAKASIALRQQKQARVFNSAGSKNVYSGPNRKATVGKDADVELADGSATVAGIKTQRIRTQINAQVLCSA
jgi:hypothetical protein